MRTHGILVLSSVLGLGACRVVGPMPPTPQRPTLSSDTSTTAVGTFELEAGIAADPDDSFSTPTTLKYGLSEQDELSATLSVLNRVDRPGRDGRGIGELTVASRHRLWASGTDSAALQLATKLPTAEVDEGLGSGELDFAAAAIFTRSVPELSWTAFAESSWLGTPNGRGTDNRHALALAGAVPGPGSNTLFGELAHTGGAGPDDLFATVGVARSTGNAILDGALLIGLDGPGPDLVLLFGITVNLGHPSAMTSTLPRP